MTFVPGEASCAGVSDVEAELAEAGWGEEICPRNENNVIEKALNRKSPARVIAEPGDAPRLPYLTLLGEAKRGNLLLILREKLVPMLGSEGVGSIVGPGFGGHARGGNLEAENRSAGFRRLKIHGSVVPLQDLIGLR